MLDADGFRGGDLHVVDVIAVPQRLDDVVRKAKDHHVLDGLFAEIVVDAVDLVLRQNLLQFLVELFGGFQVMAKGLFDDHARPAVVFFLGQSAFAQLFDDRGEEPWRDRQIEEPVTERVMQLVGLFHLLFQPLVGLGVLKITTNVIDALGDPFPELQVDRGRRDRKSTRLNSSHSQISYAVFCLKKKKTTKFYITSAALLPSHTAASEYSPPNTLLIKYVLASAPLKSITYTSSRSISLGIRF